MREEKVERYPQKCHIFTQEFQHLQVGKRKAMAGTTNIVQQKSKGLWTKSKRLRLWILNLVLFTCFVLLSLTGLITWVILPRGYRFRDGGELYALRHTLIETWSNDA